MKHRILDLLASFADAVSRRCREVQFRDTMKRRNDAGAYWVGVVVLVCLPLHACGGPSPATRTALDELRRLDAECQASAAAAAEEATSYADGQARLNAAREGCIERARIYCAAHRLDCSEVIP